MSPREDREDLRVTFTAIAVLVLASFLYTIWLMLQLARDAVGWLLGL